MLRNSISAFNWRVKKNERYLRERRIGDPCFDTSGGLRIDFFVRPQPGYDSNRYHDVLGTKSFGKCFCENVLESSIILTSIPRVVPFRPDESFILFSPFAAADFLYRAPNPPVEFTMKLRKFSAIPARLETTISSIRRYFNLHLEEIVLLESIRVRHAFNVTIFLSCSTN